jgi:ACS family glucarate transporter-like MFS transporter
MIPTRYLLVSGTFLLAMLLYVDRVCISTAQGPITTDLKLTDTEFGWALSAFALGYALCQTPTGMLADRYGPRLVLTAVVTLWSLFTGLTGAVTGLAALLVVRLLFGAGEAGAFPGMARAIYAWIPMRERGIAQGINFSGGRLGAAFALPVVAGMVEALGWRQTFVVLMLVGFGWAVVWFLWFRDDPAGHPGISEEERTLILTTRQQAGASVTKARPLSVAALLGSANLWLLMLQYFCSNFTFFFCLSWLFPHLKKTYQLEAVTAGWYAAAPFVAGALGNVWAGWLVDRIYRLGRWKHSRLIPAVLGFVLAAVGLVASASMDTADGAVAWLSVAIFGADMTLSPSWAVCVDIGRHHAGAVSGTMNMAGNLGSFVTALAFPYLLAWTGSVSVFFFTGAALNLLAVGAWLGIHPDRPLESDGRTQPT